RVPAQLIRPEPVVYARRRLLGACRVVLLVRAEARGRSVLRAKEGQHDDNNQHGQPDDREPVADQSPPRVRPKPALRRERRLGANGYGRLRYARGRRLDRHQRYLILGSTTAYARSTSTFAIVTINV